LNKFYASKKDPFCKCLFFLIIMLVKYVLQDGISLAAEPQTGKEEMLGKY
jgi:hypothetical protein